MAVGERSLSVVLQDIIGNVQEIIRSEVRLAKTELRDQASSAKAWAQMLAAGVVTSLFAILFLLLTLVYALADVMPIWAAALSVGAALAIAAAIMLTAGLKSCKLTTGRKENTGQEESHEPNNARNKVSH